MDTWSKSYIAKETGVDRRSVDKYLDTDDFPADNVINTRKEWGMRTICVALAPLLAKTSSKSEVDVDLLEPIDKKHHYDAELKKNQLEALERSLIPVDEVREVLSAALKELSLGLDIIPDRIELKCGLATDQIAAMIEILDECKSNLADSLADLANE